jgi:hypothetical protein
LTVSTREIRTSIAHSACDVCGRTLLRGERAEVYLSGATRRSVCELCTSRALHGGWVREGEVPEYGESSARVDRRRSLLGRLRGRRDLAPPADPAPELADDEEPRGQPSAPTWPDPVPRPVARPVRAAARAARSMPGPREPRHVRAVPTSTENKISSAVTLFNASEHPRTVAGIARSLGLPEVSVHPADLTGSAVHVVVSWELCWYRYELDLSDEAPIVRVAGQGYELSELSPIDLEINAVADDRGRLDLGA